VKTSSRMAGLLVRSGGRVGVRIVIPPCHQYFNS
jgi:hypothetical protein